MKAKVRLRPPLRSGDMSWRNVREMQRLDPSYRTSEGSHQLEGYTLWILVSAAQPVTCDPTTHCSNRLTAPLPEGRFTDLLILLLVC